MDLIFPFLCSMLLSLFKGQTRICLSPFWQHLICSWGPINYLWIDEAWCYSVGLEQGRHKFWNLVAEETTPLGRAPELREKQIGEQSPEIRRQGPAPESFWPWSQQARNTPRGLNWVCNFGCRAKSWNGSVWELEGSSEVWSHPSHPDEITNPVKLSDFHKVIQLAADMKWEPPTLSYFHLFF